MKISKLICTAAMTSAFAFIMWGQAAPATGPQWKDQAEFDLFTSITKETSPAKRLEGLNSWKEKYADTAFKKERLLIYLTTYAALQQNAKVIESAKEILAIDPAEFNSLFYITSLTPVINDTSAGALDTGEKGARGVLSNLDTVFAAAKKPAETSDAAWATARTASEVAAHKTLAWIGTARKQSNVTQDEYKKILTMTPGDAAVSYAMAQSIQSEKNPKRQSEVLFYYARAAVYDGPGALNPAGRKQVDDYLAKAYKNFHGSSDGLDEVKNLAKTNAIAPADFKIVSTAEIEAEKLAKEEELKKKDPQLAVWIGLKAALSAADGMQYFDSGLKEALAPKLRGKLISQSPALKPKTLVLALSDSATPEVTLNLTAPLAGKAEPGTELQFEAVAKTLTQSPFMLTMEVEKEKLEGWPAQAAPVHHAPVRSKAAAKKKK